ncbi:MAG: hypothetical protein IJQ68_04610 [Methanobrevibacter sp.]|uniref:hypothetical protein n=1 Tax=Methanobrevibacter sp. TaxID=66852 RepID=UPI0025DA577C|nr:hypothetical protein [Methanobrevibacter sp.]MBR0271259.1 hypothetical protein [Methanobrevibacter sp.]
MKLKLGIIYGILIWLLTYIISNIFQPVMIENIIYMNIIVPISIIIVAGFFGILYIRNFNENEVIEGIKVGILFIIIDIICDMLFFIIPNNQNALVLNYPLHIAYMVIIILIITTLLGYLAQMNIELK